MALSSNPANYRARLLGDALRTIISPVSALYLIRRLLAEVAPQRTNVLLSRCALTIPTYVVFVVLWNIVSNIWTSYGRKREVASLGARPIPQVVGKWPGNVDILLRMMKSTKTHYIMDVYKQLFEEYQCTTLNLRILWIDNIISMDQEHSKFVVATGFQHFSRGRFQKERMETFFGEGIFNRDDEKWKMHRNMARPFFARERISDFELFERYSSQTLSILASSEAAGEAIEIQDLFTRFSLDAASEFLFGRNIGTLSLSRPIPGKGKLGPKGSATDDSWGSFTYAFETAQQVISQRARIGRLWPLFELFCDRNVGHAKVIQEYLDPLVQRAMDDHAQEKRAGVSNSIADKTFLQHLVEGTEDRVIIRDQLLSMLLASRDTTACVLTFVTYILSTHPDVADKLRSEILSVVGPDATPTYDQLRNLKYLRAVLNETLRLFPPVPLNTRESRNASFTLPIPDPSYRSTDSPDPRPLYMPANTTILYFPLLMHRNAALWGEDAEVFDPERWLDKERLARIVANPMMFTPFSAGPRICVGQNYAYNEMSYFLVRFLQRFQSFSLAPEMQPEGSLPPPEWKNRKGRQATEKIWPGAALTLFVKGGLWVHPTAARS